MSITTATKGITVLGISACFHDAAACVIKDGHIVAAAQEERFTRKKQDASLPEMAVKYCLAEAGIENGELDAVVFYDKPIEKFYRILETYLSVAPKGLKSFIKVLPSWLQNKLWLPPQIDDMLVGCGISDPVKLYFTKHHESHAGSAFYPSPFEEAAILTIDGVGEWTTASISVGEGSSVKLLQDIQFPHSLGMLYSAFTYFCGFKINEGEYKLMGLAPYGKDRYSEKIINELMDLKEDGSFRLNMDCFAFLDDLVMVNEQFCDLFDGQPREVGASITQREMDIARSVQAVTEQIVLRMAKHARQLTGKKYLCMAGGVALNCVANGKLIKEKVFDEVWVQPAAGDAGGALGAAMSVYYNEFNQPRKQRKNGHDDMEACLLGPAFSEEQIKEYLDALGITYQLVESSNRANLIAKLIAEGKVIGLFDGRMEFGPRSLGNRSIVADPRSEIMQATLNQKIKFRESFRPFAASVLEERMSEYFDIEGSSPYMLLVAKLNESFLVNNVEQESGNIYQQLAVQRSTLPAVTHVDNSCRLQSVNERDNPAYYDILKAFERETGCGAIINTSFNVRDEPIVCTPSDAYRCFMKTNMDYLVLGSFLINKEEQAGSAGNVGWENLFAME